MSIFDWWLKESIFIFQKLKKEKGIRFQDTLSF